MKNYRYIAVFIFFIPFLFSCSKEKETFLNQELIKKWQFDYVTDSEGRKVKEIGNEDYLTITLEENLQTFAYNIQKENIVASGEWILKDSLLSFSYDLPAFSSLIDSTVYSVVNMKPMLVYYKNGREITRLDNDALKSDRKVRNYKITEWSEKHLVFQEDGISYAFKYVAPAVYESSMSLMSVMRGMLGMFVLILITFLFSANRKAINWALVGKGLLIQLVFAICVLKVPFVQNIFETCSRFFVVILSFTREGSVFLFGGLVNNINSYGFIFAFQVLPTIIFFSALTSLLFYLGIIQRVVFVFAWVMKKIMRLSGAESLAAAGNIFLGQTEAPLLIKPYIDKMTRSEIFCLMCGGMATIAGGVLAAYVGFLGGDDPVQQLFFAKHLLAASVMSAPAAIVAAKILVPETEEVNTKMEVSKEKIGGSALESIANGTIEGLKLAVNVGAMLIVFIALVAMVNYFFSDIIGHYTGLNAWVMDSTGGQYKGFSLQFILGYGLKPLAWLMGISWADSALIGQLLGEKTILNEFVAYVTLGDLKNSGAFVEEKSIIIATYILCGFANFASIGIQIGGIGTLAPNKKELLSNLGMKALIGGTMASLFTAVIVGMLL